MTNEEAIEVLKDLWRYEHSEFSEKDIREAINIAIRALKNEQTEQNVGMCQQNVGEMSKKQAEGDLISKFRDYQIEWLTSHNDIDLHETEMWVVQFLRDTAECFVKTELPSAEKTAEWIPVNERLPEIHQDVILSLRSLDIEVGFRAETEPYFYCHGADGCYIDPKNVLAWMPLPEPYKAESEDKK